MKLARLLPSANSPIIRWASYALLTLALVYCGVALARLGTDDLLSALSVSAWIVTGAAGAAYALALILLALSWAGMAGRDLPRHLPMAESWSIYGPGVIAKYIPGSIFQYGSRQLLGAKVGLGQAAMAKASLIEVALHLAAAAFCSATLLLGAGAYGLAAIAVIGSLLVLKGPQNIIGAAGFHFVFFALFAWLVAIIASQAIDMAEAFRLAGIFLVAWMAGFLVPVAPGGIGVRESVLIALYGQSEAGVAIAAFAILTRFVTTLGDALFGLVGYWLLAARRANKQASA